VAGVPQGSLFNIYINDLPCAENDNVAVSVYARDMNVTVLSGSIQLALNKQNYLVKFVEPWFKE
jgi:hypothetical protein